MAIFLRLTSSAVLMIGVLTSLAYFEPTWATTLGLDFWRLPQYEQALIQQRELAEELRQRREVQFIQNDRRIKIIDDLMAENLDLVEATQQIITGSDPGKLRFCLQLLQMEGKTEAEQIARMVIHWASMRHGSTSESVEHIKRELEVQLESALQNGRIAEIGEVWRAQSHRPT